MKTFTAALIFILLLVSPVLADKMKDLEDILVQIESGDFNESDDVQHYLEGDSSNHEQALNLFQDGYVRMRSLDYHNAYDLFNRSLALLEKEPFPRLEIELLFYMSELEIIFQKIPSALSNSLRLKELSSELGVDSRLVDAYYNLALGYRMHFDERESKYYADKAFNLSNEVNCDFGIALYHSYLGDTALGYENSPEEAMKYYSESRDYMPERAYNQLIVDYRTVLDIAMLYTRIHHLQDDNIMNDLTDLIQSANQDNHFQMYGLHMLAGDYYDNLDKDKAIVHYTRSLDEFERINHIDGSKLSPAYIKMALGNAHFDKGNYEMAALLYHEIIAEQVDSGMLNQWVESYSYLDDNKHSSYLRRLSLLEELSISNEEKAALSQKLTYIFMALTVVLVLFLVTVFMSARENMKIQKKLYKASITDSMTKVYNRAKIINILEDELAPNDAVAMIDVDDFKQINDRFGHLVGDQVLIRISETIMSSIREGDAFGRYGGEEFLVHFKDVTLEEAIEISERIRMGIMNLKWDDPELQATISIGIAACRKSNLDDVLNYADKLLYLAKSNGKNQIVTG